MTWKRPFALCILVLGTHPSPHRAIPLAAALPGPDRSRAEAIAGPRVFFLDTESGPNRGGPRNLGAPISIFGKGFGAARGGSRVTIGGVEVAAYLIWGENNAHNPYLDMIVVQPGPRVQGGPVVVTVGGQDSNAGHRFTVNSGRIYYVAPGGSDSAPCSETSPCATILHAAAEIMRPGDVLLVRGGTYPEGEIWIRESQGGAPGQPKTIRNFPGEEAVLDNPQRDFLLDASYVTVAGLRFRNGKSLNAVGWASRNQTAARFVNNTFAGQIAWAAVDAHGSEHLVAGNVCEVSGSSVGTMGHCYYISQGSNQKILYNIGSGPPGYGLHLYDERREAADFVRVIRNVLVEGNVLKNSTQRSGMIVAMGDQGNYGNRIENVIIRNNVFAGNNHAGLVLQGIARDLKVYHNTFYQNGRQALYVASDPSLEQVDIRNNLFYQAANAACRQNCEWFAAAHVENGEVARNVTLAGNSYHPGAPVVRGRGDSNPVTGPVQFANASALDFHLLPGSAAIDQTTALALAPEDFDGRPRPQGSACDTGAFEFLPRTPTLHSVVNGASMQAEPLAPGSVAVLLGWNLGPDPPCSVVMDNGVATSNLGGTRVFAGDTPVPLFYASARQVTALLPYDLPEAGEVRIAVEVRGERSNEIGIPVTRASPAIFTADGSGEGQALVINQDGTLNSTSHPAPRTSIIVFYAAGLGRTDPPSHTGRAAEPPLPQPLAPVSVWLDGQQADLLYAGAAWGLLSNVFQINARIPAHTGTGEAIPIALRAGDAASRDVTFAVR